MIGGFGWEALYRTLPSPTHLGDLGPNPRSDVPSMGAEADRVPDRWFPCWEPPQVGWATFRNGGALSYELNKRVAEAMGWTLVDPDDHDGPCWLHLNGKVARNGVRYYDTDPAAIPEMLEWLKKEHGSDVGFQFFTMRWVMVNEPDGSLVGKWRADTIFTFKVGKKDKTVVLSQRGHSLNEAIANLVVAVAEARKT